MTGAGSAPRDERTPIVLATRSADKSRELTTLCAAAGFASETLDDLALAPVPAEEGIERFDNFAGNAEAKARWFATQLPGRLVLSEDSGLVVDALGGAPGVRSKRWSMDRADDARSGLPLDEANNRALSEALRDVREPTARRARYVCVAILTDGMDHWRGDGSVEGRIALSPRGRGGFGYDPWFVSEELGVTFGEASASEKDRVSHRARALRALFASAHGVLALRAAARAS